MIITKKSVHIIDYKSNNVYFRNIPSNFDKYISELIDYIENNKNARPYKSTSNTIQVIVEAKNYGISEMKILIKLVLKTSRKDY